MARFVALATAVLALVVPSCAQGAVGDRLDIFAPSPNGNGRGIAVKGTSTSAYYTTASSQESIYMVDLRTHTSGGRLDTNVSPVPQGFGALDYDSTAGLLWATEYSPGNGWVDSINPGTGAATHQFQVMNGGTPVDGLDGLSLDSDGSLWISGEGEGAGPTDIYHLDQSGNLLGGASANFGNSGIAVDGDYLWLADHDGERIYKFQKGGGFAYAGVTISTGSGLPPEDLALDTCTFPGKKALWTYTSDLGGGSMAAYEIGTSTNAGCPPSSTPGSQPPSSSGPSGINLGGGGGSPIAGGGVLFDLTSTADPLGTLFTYLWNFGDGGGQVRAGGRVTHRYRCAGTYRVTATVIDTSGVKKVFTRTLGVGFATRKMLGLQIKPRVRIKGNRAKVGLSAKRASKKGARSARSRVAKIGSIDYRLDRKLAKRKRPSPGATMKIKRNRRHSLTAKIHFKSPSKTKTIKACFYA